MKFDFSNNFNIITHLLPVVTYRGVRSILEKKMRVVASITLNILPINEEIERSMYRANQTFNSIIVNPR